MEQSVDAWCPTCGESTSVWLDADDGELEVESDCQVCCRPLHVTVQVQQGVVVNVEVGAGW
jgi:hypothetical protein